MSYNNPEELLRINDFFQGRSQQSLADQQQRLGQQTMRSVADWLTLFPAADQLAPDTDAALSDHYGPDASLIGERRQAYRDALTRFAAEFGEQRRAIIVRSPGASMSWAVTSTTRVAAAI